MTDAHQRPTPRRTALAGVAVAAVALTAACGGGTADTTPAAEDGATGAPTSAPTSAPASPSVSATLDAAAVRQLFTRAMAAATSVHLDLAATGSMAMTGSGDLDMKAKPMKADLTLRSPALGGDDARVLMVDDAMFLRVAQLGDKYLKVPLGGAASPLGQLGLDSLDPVKLFDKFGGAITGGVYVGKDTVAGQPADHYRLQVDAKAIVSALPDLAPQASATPATETVDLWLDGAGRYRRMRMDVGGEKVTETFSRWGEPVAVKAPPAGQVQDMGSALSGRGGSSGS
jgi:hypothetical protein